MSPPPFVSPQTYADYYTRQVGHGLPVYSGGVVQHGFGLGSLILNGLRSALPLIRPAVKRGGQAILKKALSSSGKKLAREALGAGMGVAANALKDHLGSRKNQRKAQKSSGRVSRRKVRRSQNKNGRGGGSGHKRNHRKPVSLSRRRVNVQARAPDIFDE